MTVLRRYLVLLTLMFWQGGFTFYSAVVVAVGSAVLGSHLEQGLVTRSVSNYLNLAGAVALVAGAWDIASAADPSIRRRWLRWALWSVSLLTLGMLVWLHLRLDELLDLDASAILDRPRFRELHRAYLWVSTVQWAANLILTAATLLAWRAEDMGNRLPATSMGRDESTR
jgi:hypothetical protein